MKPISDIKTESGRRYAIDFNGFVAGARQYVDREYTFDYVPDVALGHTHIRTAGNDKMIPEDGPTSRKKQPAMNEEKAVQVLSDRLNDPQKVMELLPEDVREQLKYGQYALNAQREALIKRITTNTDVYTEDELKNQKLEELQKLAKAVTPASYVGQSAGELAPSDTLHENADDGAGDILLPPGVVANEEK